MLTQIVGLFSRATASRLSLLANVDNRHANLIKDNKHETKLKSGEKELINDDQVDSSTSCSSTRLIIKNIPKHVTEARLKDHLQKLGGTITDLKIIKTQEGLTRRFGFIGYANSLDAIAARDYFDRTYLDTSRLEVSFALPRNEKTLPRPWSKYSNKAASNKDAEKSSSSQNLSQFNSSTSALSDPKKSQPVDEKKKRKLEDFLGLTMKKSLVWSDQNPGYSLENGKGVEKRQCPEERPSTGKEKGEGDISTDDEEYQDLPTRKNSMLASSNHSDSSADEADDDNLANDKKHVPDPDSNVHLDDTSPTMLLVDSLDPSIIADTGRLFIRNLPFTTADNDLRDLFSPFGPLSDVHISIDKTTLKSKGFGFVLFLFAAHAIEAYSALDGKVFQGRILHLLPGKQMPEKRNDNSGGQDKVGADSFNRSGDPFRSEFQRERLAKNQEIAGCLSSDTPSFNCNSLFIRSDAVVEAMTTMHNISKSAILDHESSASMAVNVALGETQLIQECKQFLIEQGVDVETLDSHFNPNTPRSNTSILVRNIPAATPIEEIESLFSQHAPVTRIVMPPSKTMALVEFEHPNVAKLAYRKLAYRQFRDAPLFLEWAPIGTFKDRPNPSNQQSISNKEVISKDRSSSASSPNAYDPDNEIRGVHQVENKATPNRDLLLDQTMDQTSLVLFVKNISFVTQLASFESFVTNIIGKVRHITIAQHTVNNKVMSRGFGFIECNDREQALLGWKKIQGQVLDGHRLNLQFSRQTPKVDSVKESIQQLNKRRHTKSQPAQDPDSTKLIIKNVPFEADIKEIRALFSPFGELKTVRLPKKTGGNGHRGFAFVEYLTVEDARNAISLLSNTHLYGRRMVIAYANQDDNIEHAQQAVIQ